MNGTDFGVTSDSAPTQSNILSGDSTPAAQRSAEPAMDAIPEAESEQSSWGAVLRELVETVVLTLVIFLLIRTVVQNYRVDGMSMEPSFHDGQFLLISKLSYRLGEPQRGDVVVFHYPRDPERDFIKRVIGLPGETVEIRNGQVFIDGQPYAELSEIMPAGYTTRPTTLGPDELYVMGDNRPNSSDSHSWGPLTLDLIIGKVLLSYWPPDTWGLVDVATADNQDATPSDEIR